MSKFFHQVILCIAFAEMLCVKQMFHVQNLFIYLFTIAVKFSLKHEKVNLDT